MEWRPFSPVAPPGDRVRPSSSERSSEMPDDKLRDEEPDRDRDDDADDLELEVTLEDERPGQRDPDPPVADV